MKRIWKVLIPIMTIMFVTACGTDQEMDPGEPVDIDVNSDEPANNIEQEPSMGDPSNQDSEESTE
ncbi:hypothetical protein [Bacillus sp. FJAT-50079]|uniref:hypothetical protein n=1 Tax=Bacillus sp. FJAT-50079 TaxID=2833577 RepID=UPI001BC9573B|nr:hypothetical protein [Bacillus sp. FJAT-50079]MBS4207144.1 hypothetical protein [Bacillus sp. FJAT-50079]